MAKLDAEERYWIESNWKSTSMAVLAVLLPLVNDVIRDIVTRGQVSDENWRDFVLQASRALDHARLNCTAAERDIGRSRATMYAMILGWMADAEPMRDALLRARERLANDPRRSAAWLALRDGLFLMRMRGSADIENRTRTWRRVERISAEIKGRQSDSRWEFADERASAEHCEAIANHVRIHHPHDKNLPTSADRVKGFFVEFADDPVELDWLEQQDSRDAETLPDFSRAREHLSDCVREKVRETDLKVYEVHRTEGSISAFCLGEGMDRHRFNRLRDAILVRLAACVKAKFGMIVEVTA